MHSSTVYNAAGRKKKATKTLAILEDCLGNLEDRTILDIGCAAGLSSRWYARAVESVVGMDIDLPAVSFAKESNSDDNLSFVVMDSQRLGYPESCFDIVICNHIYEHVPDPHILMSEIHRVLKPDGVCFFSAGNRLSLIEPHYHLPLLSVVPKPMAHLYLRLIGRGSHYYETHLTYWGLRKLVSPFELIDYTLRVVRHPEKFNADDVILPGSFQQQVYLGLLKIVYWACPTYIWLLRKSSVVR